MGGGEGIEDLRNNQVHARDKRIAIDKADNILIVNYYISTFPNHHSSLFDYNGAHNKKKLTYIESSYSSASIAAANFCFDKAFIRRM